MSATSSFVVKKPTVIGGKLKLKGSADKAKAKKRKASTIANPIENNSVRDGDIPSSSSDPDSFLTEAQKRHKQKHRDREAQEAKDLLKTSFRERIDKFNSRLASATEHNDIPRVSAAGNG